MSADGDLIWARADAALARLPYQEIWLVDFEFIASDGERPRPICMVAREAWSGRTIRLWEDDLRGLSEPPFDITEKSLFVAYYASAELGCFEVLGWPHPARILDLFAEFRVVTNGRPPQAGNGLLGALIHYGLSAMDADEKEEMRDLVMRGEPWSESERRAILDYCEGDVRALDRLLPAMLPEIAASTGRLAQAAFRGRYMAAAARMQNVGVPLDMPLLARLTRSWDQIRSRLITRVDADYGFYENGVFKTKRFEEWLRRRGMSWPTTEAGRPRLDTDTLRDMARAHPELAAFHELRTTLSRLRTFRLSVGEDGRNRTLLSAFGAVTGRNTPSNSKSIFGPARWLRGLIRPEPGKALAYLDWSSQEIALAAALSGDERMMADYASGDIYLAFAKQAGLAPPEATKATHKAVRDRCKALFLGIGYGMGAETLAYQAGVSREAAADLIRRHRRAYPAFWRWAENNVDHALLGGALRTPFGWRVVNSGMKENSARNWPMQAAGADMMRLACCLATEAGHRVCLPVHDALLIEGDEGSIKEEAEAVRRLMIEASEAVSGGFPCRVDVTIFVAPERYMDERGAAMFRTVMELLAEVEAEADRGVD